MVDFLKRFNQPGRFFEVLGYITVIIGLLIVLLGLINLPSTCSSSGSSGTASTAGFGVSGVLIGLIIAIVCPQLFFAISKVVRAAEKYLGE